MSKVYIVTAGQYSDYRIVGVFSSREKAEQVCKIDRYISTIKDNDIDLYIQQLKYNTVLELELDNTFNLENNHSCNNLRNVDLYQCTIDCNNINIYDDKNDKEINIKKGDITTLPKMNVCTHLECVYGVSGVHWSAYKTLEKLPDGKKVVKQGHRRLITASSEKSQEHAEKLAVEARQKYERILENVSRN